jgi:hypothetical protein
MFITYLVFAIKIAADVLVDWRDVLLDKTLEVGIMWPSKEGTEAILRSAERRVSRASFAYVKA